MSVRKIRKSKTLQSDDSFSTVSSPWQRKKLQVLLLAVLLLIVYVMICIAYSQAKTFRLNDGHSFNIVFDMFNVSTAKFPSLEDEDFLTTAVPRSNIIKESSQYVLNTIGCQIPNMRVHFTTHASAYDHNVCGEPFAALEKINDTHAIAKQSTFSYCTLQHVYRSKIKGKENTRIEYSKKQLFVSNVTFEIKTDFHMIECHNNRTKKKSKDVFILLKKIVKVNAQTKTTGKESPKNERDNTKENKIWNVVMIGMDTMSRGRMLNTMAKTVSYFNKNEWIDFKGYHKIADNTAPNLIAALSGKNRGTVEKPCYGHTLDACNHDLMWSKYQRAGYITAYAEDDIKLPDTFGSMGFTKPPTNHYMRPFFLTGEKTRYMKYGYSAICTGTKSSGERILDYTLQFVQTYKREPFFGFFWMNSFSHNSANMPEALDLKLTETFEMMNKVGTLNDTFVIFLSDHGVRFGPKRQNIESYYEERLPALFMFVPVSFRNMYVKEYNSLLLNTHRLVTPYDLSLTLADILRISDRSNELFISNACPKCHSLLQLFSPKRTCDDGSIEEKWCSCHSVEQISKNDSNGISSANALFYAINELTQKVKTTNCTTCEKYILRSILRTHQYKYKNSSTKYFIIALATSSGVGYEGTVAYDGMKYTTLGTISTITPTFGRSSCVINKSLANYCNCKKIKNCKLVSSRQ